MKILLAGQFNKWAIENHYAQYLREFAEVDIYPAEEVFDAYYWSSFWNKLKYKAGVSGISNQIASELLSKARETKPDIVWIFKGMRIQPAVITALKSMGIRVVNYNPDHPFLFSGKGSGNRNVKNSIGLYDLHLCYSRDVMARIEREFNIPTAFLPFAYEMPDETFAAIEKVTEIPRACFIGNPDQIRTETVRSLSEAGIPVDVFGIGWNKFLKDSVQVRLHPAVHGAEFWRTMRAYRLQVNIFRPHNIGSHNMRTFEIPAAGGIQLAPDSPEHHEFFEEGREIFLYRDPKDLIKKAAAILAMDPSEAQQIRQNARTRSVEGGYTYAARAGDVFRAFQKIMPATKVLSP